MIAVYVFTSGLTLTIVNGTAKWKWRGTLVREQRVGSA